MIIFLGLIFLFWQDSLRAREKAKDACLRACRSYGVQLLDDTVALEKIWMRRNESGRVCLERRYVFEFTDGGMQRNGGLIVMLGARVDILALDGGDLFIP